MGKSVRNAVNNFARKTHTSIMFCIQCLAGLEFEFTCSNSYHCSVKVDTLLKHRGETAAGATAWVRVLKVPQLGLND